MLKRFAMFLRSSIKLIVLIVASIILITAAITIFYKPTYEVSLNGELSMLKVVMEMMSFLHK